MEEVLIKHPEVAEVSVVGRADREWGEVVVAYIVPKAGADVDPVSLDEFCIKNMARFKWPKYYRAVDSLPKNNYGKVLKTKLRKMEQGREQ